MTKKQESKPSDDVADDHVVPVTVEPIPSPAPSLLNEGFVFVPPKIAAALVKVQGEVKAIQKSAKNDHFKSTFAPLPDVMDTALPLLSKYGLALMQTPFSVRGEQKLHTILMHEDGNSIQSVADLLMTNKTSQQMGSAMTYLRRQSAMSILGLSAADEDDDGNASSNRLAKPTQAQLEELSRLSMDLGFSREVIEQRIKTIRTEAQAYIAIDRLLKKIEERAGTMKAARAAEAAFFGDPPKPASPVKAATSADLPNVDFPAPSSDDELPPMSAEEIAAATGSAPAASIPAVDEDFKSSVYTSFKSLKFNSRGELKFVSKVTGKAHIKWENFTDEQWIKASNLLDAITSQQVAIDDKYLIGVETLNDDKKATANDDLVATARSINFDE